MKNERVKRASGLFRTADLVAGLQTLEPRMLLAGDGAQNEPLLDFGVEVVQNVTLVNGTSATVSGELKKWHKITLDFEGPQTSESASNNPFLNYRLDVTFEHTGSGKTYVVPGYFAADGDAGNSHSASGNIWRAHFAPDETGEWTYTASFRSGTNVAVNNNPLAGSSAGFFDGDTGSFAVAETDKDGIDLRGKGRLEYVGEHYLQFAETGEYFLKQGPDAPENLLAYSDFDGDFKTDGQKDNLIKDWQPHVQDWNPGDPTWDSEDADSVADDGKGLIGAVNYLASEGLNAFSFLTMNIGGDDRNVHPYTGYGERVRLDVSRLAQWEVVFEHADTKGMYLHFKTQETENDQLLDGGDLGNQRKLYYRELIARFSHHLALNWNLGEETTNTTSQLQDFAQYFHDNDPYQHNVVVHTYPGQQDQRYNPLLGNNSELTGASVQTGQADFRNVHRDALKWVTNSANAGKKWVVAVDEPGDAQSALRPDNDAGNSHVDGRKNALWGTLMAGGAGNEWYFGYGHAHSDLTLDDFRSRDAWWDYTRYAMEFFQDNDIPFWEMQNDNDISTASNDYGFYKAGEYYTAYLKNGGTTSIDLSQASGQFEVKWFDPRNGGDLQDGTVTSVFGGGTVSVGQPPNATGSDWAVLVRKVGLAGQSPYLGAAQKLEDGTIIQAEHYDNGGEGVAYHDGDQESKGNPVRGGSVDKAGATNVVGEAIGWTEDGEWLEYTIDATVGTYYATLRYSANGANVGSVKLLIGEGPGGENFQLLGTFDLNNTGAWTNWEYATLSGIQIPGGEGQVLRLEFDGAGFDIDQIEFTSNPPVNTAPNVSIDKVTQLIDEPEAEGVYEEQNGLVVMEMEDTESPLGLWREQTTYANYTGSGYLQFTGNDTASGPATSPLTFTFKINKSGLYRLHLRAAKDTTNGQPSDHSNDAYVRVDGDYGAGPNAGNNHGDDAQLNTLKSNTKFFVGGPDTLTWNSGNRLDLGGHDNKRVAVYDFKAGEEYTLVVSGRSKWFSLDRIVFRHVDTATGTAQNLNTPTSPQSDGGDAEVVGYQLDATVTDDGRNVAPPTLKWTKVSGLGDVTFDDDTMEDVIASFSESGHYVLRLTANDGEHTTSQTISLFAATEPNQAPVVSAGDDQNTKFPNNTVDLDGTVTDDGLTGQDVETEWSVVAQPAGALVSFGDKDAVDTTATFSQPGTYVLQLSADDGDQSTIDEVTVVVRSEFEPLVFNPIDDAYIQSGTNFNNDELRVEVNRRTSYLRFNVSGLAGQVLTSAKLRLRVDGDPGSGNLSVHRGSHANWTEDNLSDANKPTPGPVLDTVGGSHAEGQWKEFDVTAAITGDGLVTFVVQLPAGSNDVWFSSSEGASSPELLLEVSPPPTVVQATVFYDDSAFDGTSDNDAVDTSKQGLEPGEAATFENYTNYDKGLNGVVVDIRGLASQSLTAADFGLRIKQGSSNSWSAAPTPTISVLPGQGLGGSDRVMLAFDSPQMKNVWLEVTTKATDNTGLTEDDVFYIGNAVADTGNSTEDTTVTSRDLYSVYTNRADTAGVGNVYDLNKDGAVDNADVTIARGAVNTVVTDVDLLVPASGDLFTLALASFAGPIAPASLMVGMPMKVDSPALTAPAPVSTPTEVYTGLTHTVSSPVSNPVSTPVFEASSDSDLEERLAELAEANAGRANEALN